MTELRVESDVEEVAQRIAADAASMLLRRYQEDSLDGDAALKMLGRLTREFRQCLEGAMEDYVRRTTTKEFF